MDQLLTSIPVLVGIYVFGSLCSLTDARNCHTYYSCAKVGYRSEKFHVDCNFWKWGRCTRYRTTRYTYYQTCMRTFCCKGYTGPSCSQAVCHGSTSCPNGGKCTRPNYCTCQSGFASPQCTDINECLQHNGGCSHTCINTAGSYICRCKTGFSLASDGRSCIDINECLQHNGGCSDACTNTIGSHKCRCQTRFTLANDGKTCIDANECLSNNGGCDHLCINENPGYRCDCRTGYKLVKGTTCVDINECIGGGRCAHSCQNTVGSFKCSCRSGFTLGKDNVSCHNVEDCAGVTCFNDGRCVDLVGSYNCKCNVGFTGKHCETDINECLIINGGCEDLCINTNGSFHCQCSSGTSLDKDGFSCIGNNTNGISSVFETHKIPQRLLPRGCDYITVTSCNRISSPNDIILSSTSAWYSVNLNSSVSYTFGVVFMEIHGLSIPVSISGVQVYWSESSIELKIGSLQYNENDDSKLNNKHNGDCFSFSTTPRYIRDMIASFLPTVFNKLNTILPDWIGLSSLGTEVLSVTDLKTDLLFGKELAKASECTGAPIQNERLYNVFRFGAGMAISLYGHKIQLPKPLRGNKYCVIVDICEDLAGTLFLIVPPESRNFLDDFELLKPLQERGFNIRPRGVGISLLRNIDVHYKTREIQLWNGDHLFKYSTFPLANIWLFTDMGWTFNRGIFGLDVQGSVEMFFSLPKISNFLAGIFVDEWNVLVQLKRLSGTPSLTFKLFDEDVVLQFKDAAVASFDAYLSIGGSSSRSWCGNHANPEGFFVSFMADVNPFRHVPILRHWIFDFNVRLYAFLTSSPDHEPNQNTRIDIMEDIVILKNMVERFGKLLNRWVDRIGHTLTDAVKQLFHVLNEVVYFLVGKVVEVIKSLTKLNFNIAPIINSLTNISSFITQEINPACQKIINALEFDIQVIKHNITLFIENEKSQIQRNVELIISKVMNQIMSAVSKTNGFGLRFSAFVKILNFEFSLMDIEMVYSVDRLGGCNKFSKAYSLLKGEPSMRILARATERRYFGYFVILDVGGAVSLAFSASTDKFVMNFNAHVSLLGIKVTGDIIINNKMLEISLEGNIWGVYFATVSAIAEVGKKWNELSFAVKGRLLVKRGDNDFGGSLLDGLRSLTQKAANLASTRITEAQHGLTLAQKGLSWCQTKLSNAQREVWKGNKGFDAAVRALDRVKDRLEKAKGPFRVALAKLNRAQRNVDNLCRIRTCHSICVPGVKLRICRGWIPYPCFKRTSCMLRLPNVACHLANAVCYAVRGVAYVALEAAKLFVRAPMLALDVAKGLVSAAQFVVDKSRVVLVLANGVLEVAKLGLETVKGAIEVAKTALEGVKFVVRAAFHVFEMIIKYGLQNLLDVKNCRFELELTTTDKAEFDVSCEVKAFGLDWHKLGFEFDFRHPIVSMLNIAKSIVNTLLDMVKDVFGKRKRREISYMSMTKLHHILRYVKRDVGYGNATNGYLNSTIFSDDDRSIGFRKRFNNREEYFDFHCKQFLKIHTFLLESVNLLFNITNESSSALNDVQYFRQDLDTMDINITSMNFTAESFGISPECALRDYNLTEDELQEVLNGVKDTVSNDVVLNEMANSTNFARDAIDSQLQEANSISIIDHWLYGIRNHSEKYFNDNECVGFQDCVLHSFSELYDIFSDKDIVNSTQNQNATNTLEDEILLLFQNRSASIDDAHRLSMEIINNLNVLNESNAFCSQAPKISHELQNITVLTGSQVRLMCVVKGDPQPKIEWFHNNTIIRGENMESLVLLDVTVAQEGLYKCMAENVVTKVTAEVADVTIKECQPGTYYALDRCVFCKRGFWQSEWNQRTCKACPIGYSTESTGTTQMSSCSDVDECIGSLSVCEQKCFNNNGSYGCGCNDGFVLTSDSRSCKEQNDVVTVKIAAGVVGGFACLVLSMLIIWKLKQAKHLKIRPMFSNDNHGSKEIETTKQRPVVDSVRKPVLKQSFFQANQIAKT